MTNRDVALLAFKVVGLWLMAMAAIGVANIPYLWSPDFEAVRAITVAATILPLLVAIGIGVPVWLSADWFASRIFPNESSDPLRLDRLRGEPLFALALSIIGVFFVCESLPAIVNSTSLFVLSRAAAQTILGDDPARREQWWNEGTKANAAAAVARLVIGLLLMAGPARLAAAFVKVKRELRGELMSKDPAERNSGSERGATATIHAGDENRDPRV